MIPYRDENPTRIFPVLTLLIVIANVLVFLHQQTLPYGGAYIYGAVPGHITLGRDYGRPMLEPAWLTVFTSMFMHGSWMHLIGNMLFLWIFGNNIEELMGRSRFLFFYLICGVVAAALQIAMSTTPAAQQTPMVGASGAVAGVLGAYFIKYPTARVRTLLFLFIIVLPAYVVLGFWFVFQLLNAMMSAGSNAVGGVAFFAHVGGFVAGTLLVHVFSMGRRRKPAWLE